MNPLFANAFVVETPGAIGRAVLCTPEHHVARRARSGAPYHPYLRRKGLKLSCPLVFIRGCLCGDTDFRDSRALQCVHHSDQFLHRQIAIGANYNGDIRIRLFQLHQLRRQSFKVHHLIIEPDRVGAIDRHRLHMRRVNGRILRAAGWDHQVHTAFEQRRCNHEYDEQHKSEIQQRRNIYLAQRGEILALRVTSHLPFLRRSALDVGRWALKNICRKRRTPNAERSMPNQGSMLLICERSIPARRDRRTCARTQMPARRRSCPSPR
jgi:hypothetical protein